MKINQSSLIAALASGFVPLASAAVTTVDFSYTQTSGTTGSGTVSGVLDVGPAGGSGGMVNFTGVLPLASVFNPNPLTTQVGAVGAIDSQEGDTNDPTDSVGIYFTNDGTLTGGAQQVTLTGSSGSETYTVVVDLVFPDLATFTGGFSYTFNLSDDGVTGGDAIGSPTLASFLGSTATNTGQNRQTFGFAGNAPSVTFAAGVDPTSSSVFTAENAPGGGAGSVGPLGLYVGYRSGTLAGTFSVDQIEFNGILAVDEATIMVIPEPSSLALFAGFGVLALGSRRRRN